MKDWERAWKQVPFLNSGSWTVDWGQAGSAAIGIVLASLFGGIADVIAQLWRNYVILPAEFFATASADFVGLLVAAFEQLLVFEAARDVARETGLVGAIAIMLIGGFLIAQAIEVVR